MYFASWLGSHSFYNGNLPAIKLEVFLIYIGYVFFTVPEDLERSF